jgi:hypothetical protein
MLYIFDILEFYIFINTLGQSLSSLTLTNPRILNRGSMYIPHVPSVAMVEVLAMLNSLSLSSTLGCSMKPGQIQLK